MPLSNDEFWKLIAISNLYTPDECTELAARFASRGSATAGDAQQIAHWLVETETLTRYQAAVLLAGRPGPFVLGPFVITERIESGRLSKIFRARFDGKQNVCLVMLGQLTDDARDFQLLADLAKTAATIKSPHVTRTYLATRQGSQAFVVAESPEGHTLAAELSRPGRLPRHVACQIALQAALGLVSMHAAGLAHGGICPSNIWLDRATNAAKVMQFPLVLSPRRLPRREMPLVDYVAPELTGTDIAPTPSSDIYSLGCLLFELIATRVPFPGGTPSERIVRHQREFPQRLDQIDPSVPEELADLVEEMLAKDPVLRSESANSVAHLLAPFCSQTKGGEQPPKLESSKLAPGYGAWKAPTWAPPPQQQPPIAKSGQKAPTKKAANPAPTSAPPKPAEAPTRAARPAPATPASQTKLPADAVRLDDSKHEPESNYERAEATQARSEAPSRNEGPPLVTEPPQIIIDTGTSKRAVEVESPLALVDPRSEPKAPLARSRRRTPPLLMIAIGGTFLAVLGLTITAVIVNRSDTPSVTISADAGHQDISATPDTPLEPNDQTTSPDPEAAPEVPPDEITTDAAGSNARPESAQVFLTSDDGKTLWASPTSGPPLVLSYLPSGVQVIAALRPAALLASPEGPKLLASLGPTAVTLADELQRTIGIPMADIEQMIVAFVPDESLAIQTCYVVQMAENLSRDELLNKWGNPQSTEHEGKTFYQNDKIGYYFPPDNDRTVVIAPVALLKQALELNGEPLLRRGIESLLAHSDQQRHLTLLFTPTFLLTDGRELLVGPLAQLHGPLREFLDESIEAAMLSAHVDQELYVELRAVPNVGTQPQGLKNTLWQRWEKIPERVESHVAALTPSAYGQLVVHRFPRMLQLARDYTRSGVEDRQAVLSAYLPAAAAHNLLLGADLTLLESSGTEKPAVAEAAAPKAQRTASDALGKKITLSFPRDSLEGALAIMAEELGVPIVIRGADLQLDGITRNQSLNGVDERDQPAGEVLRKLLKMANRDGKLVYQIQSDDAGRETLFITTRSAAQKRGEPLPAEF